MKCYICSSDLINLTESLYKCNSCNTLQRGDLQKYYDSVRQIYNKDYYHHRYQCRYGKDIKDDIDNIRKLAIRRIEIIENIYLREGECNGCSKIECSNCYVRNFVSSLRNKKILDIGCGMGIFLEVAQARGYETKGIDINKNVLHLASSSVRDNILITDINLFEAKEKFDIITMWYVLEHLPNPEEVIEKVWSMLKYGGIFAVSTPNGYGATARFKPSWYYSIVPEDHIFEFNPKSLSILLTRNKFKVVKVVNTGFHPERITNIPVLKNLVGVYQRLIQVGDTFEIYSVKKF